MTIGAAVNLSSGPIEGVSEVEVLEPLGRPVQFRIRVDLPIIDGDFPLLRDDGLGPDKIVGIIAGGQCLVRGVITGHRVHFGGDDASTSVDIVGADRSIEMGREEKVAVWSGVRASDAVSTICGTYSFAPTDVMATSETYATNTHELLQRGSDLDFVQLLAHRTGAHFWITSDVTGAETAHFQRPQLDAAPDLTLGLHLDDANLDSVELWWDADRGTTAKGAGLDLSGLARLDGSAAASPLPAAVGSRLADVVTQPRTRLTAAPGDTAAALLERAEGIVVADEMFVRARLNTTAERAQAVVRSHRVVHLDGVGFRHSGHWFVTSVHHVIDAVSHRMTVELARNGWET
ncbi:MAG: hypothetical protein GY713_11675 [Actinomycetia bacterium]|nr:hypothetical protein [Actinomycetes bacterium]